MISPIKEITAKRSVLAAKGSAAAANACAFTAGGSESSAKRRKLSTDGGALIDRGNEYTANGSERKVR